MCCCAVITNIERTKCCSVVLYTFVFHPVICTMSYYFEKDKKRSNSIPSNPSLIPEALEELLDCVEQPFYHLLTIY